MITAIYVSATQFTVVGDQTEFFVAGRRVKADCGVDGYKYVTVDSSAYVAVTTVTIAESELTNNLTGVQGSVLKPTTKGNVSEHAHSTAESDGGTIPHSNIGSVGENDHHNRSHAITSTADHAAGNWKILYTDGSGDVQELALGNRKSTRLNASHTVIAYAVVCSNL